MRQLNIDVNSCLEVFGSDQLASKAESIVRSMFHQILRHMEWIMSVAIKGGSNMCPIMLTNIWIFCRQVLTSPHLRIAPNPDGGHSFKYEEREGSDLLSAVFVVNDLTLANIEEQIATKVMHGFVNLLNFLSDKEPQYTRACVLLGPGSGGTCPC